MKNMGIKIGTVPNEAQSLANELNNIISFYPF